MIDVILGALIGQWEIFSLLALCIALFVYLKAEKPSWHALAGIGCYAAAVVLMSLWGLWDASTDEGLHKAYEVWATGNHISAIVYLGALFAFLIWPPKKTDALTQLIWLVVLFSEGWTGLMENVNCNFIATDIPRELQTVEQMNMSVCERIYGWWYRYIPLVLEIGIVFYFAHRWRSAKALIRA